MRDLKALVLFTAVIAAVAVLGGGGPSPAASAGSIALNTSETSGPTPAVPITFHCAFDASCPEILVVGDPHATLGGNPAPFRGYGDPSLELDPDTGTLWLSYSWLDLLISDPGPPPVADFGVRTHLARSDDGGATLTFVRQVNDFAAIQHPDTSEDGWSQHEVSTLVREGPGAWQLLWLTYFDPFGTQERFDYYYQRSLASSPANLGDSSTAWAQGYGTSPSWGVAHDLSVEIPELSDCLTPTEPALIRHDGETYLATNCVVIDETGRRDDLERLVLLKQEVNGYSYVGELLDYDDAVDLGGTRLEQTDLAIAQNGAILLITTPIQDSSPNHLGCVVLEVTDLATAQVRRDASGDAVVLASITGEDPLLGPGLCTYDAASSTGVMMVLHAQSFDPLDILFSLRATGVHPQGIDSDSDGVADTVDNCPNVANPWQENNVQPATPAGDHCEDTDIDGVADAVDNCPNTPNPTQEDTDGDGIGDVCDSCQVSLDGFLDADDDCIQDSFDNCPDVANDDQDDADGDLIGDACDSGDTDFDSVSDETEYHCGSPRDDGALIPERVDGPFTGANDDGDGLIDEALLPFALGFDCDGDGYTGAAENNVYSYVGQTDGDQKTCQEYDTNFTAVDPNQTSATPSLRWPSDFNSSASPIDSFNRLNILDLTAFLAPVKYFGTDLGTNPGDVRWDLTPGKGVFPTDINIQDITAMIAGSSGAPPMLGGAKALFGPVCPWAP